MVNTVLETHFDGAVKSLQILSDNLYRLTANDEVGPEALMSDTVRHFNDASRFLYFIRRDSDEDIKNLEDLINESFRQVTTQLTTLREGGVLGPLTGVLTMTNVALRLATARLTELRTEKE